MNEHARPAAAPHRPITFAPARARRATDPDGTIRITCPEPLAPYDPSLARLFRAAVEAQPTRTFLQERTGDGWRKLSYEEARHSVDAVAAALIEHALLMLAGYTAGVPVAPISVAYSLQSQDFAKLKHIAELLKPDMIYVADTGPFAKAVAAIGSDAEIVASRDSTSLGATLFGDLTRTPVGRA